jgi:uroporphyrinogen decarboxylase
LTVAVTAYLKMQIDAGIDALQIFDSHGGHLAPAEFYEASGRWITEIIRALAVPPVNGAAGPARPRHEVPAIVFSLGTHENWPDLIQTGADVIGIDWQTSLSEARKILPAELALQGNLAPALLAEATPELVATETKRVLEAMRGRPGHIFNLGHGLLPASKLENIASLAETVRNHR